MDRHRSAVGYQFGQENCIYMCDGVNNCIVKLNMEGQVIGTLSSYGKVPGKLNFVHNISLDSTGALDVAEIKNWRVQKFAVKLSSRKLCGK